MDLATITVAALERAAELESHYLLPTYARIPLLLERGRGAFVVASDGRRYLDCITGIGVNVLGYGHPRIVKAVRQQAGRLLHSSNLYYNEFQPLLARRLTELAGMERAFFTNSGAEAVESALKIARAHGRSQSPEKTGFVALEHSFHGRSFGALAVTGQPKYRAPFEPLVPGARFVAAGDLAALAAAIDERTCAVILEPIQGEGGVRDLDPAFFAAAAERARAHGALLICDEIQCGLGRTGRPFAYQWSAVTPDLVVCAKPLACGLPLGAVLVRGAATTALTLGMHGTTFGGGPLACRVALEFLDILEEEQLLANVGRVGAEMKTALEALRRRNPAIRAVRGHGLILGIELDRPAKPVVEAARAKGLLVNVTQETVIRLLPPYILTSAQAARAVRILAAALRAAGISGPQREQGQENSSQRLEA